jgi:hypothetical protein
VNDEDRCQARALMLCLSAGAALAQDKKPMSIQDAMTYVKKMNAQDRGAMMDQAKQIDQQLSQLQSQVRDLMRQLEKAPKYLDEPLKNNNIP